MAEALVLVFLCRAWSVEQFPDSYMHAYTEELGPGAIKTMATIKRALDPYNILNPGKVLHQTIDPKTGRHHLCV